MGKELVQNILLVGCGSFVGGALRYAVGQALAGRMALGFAVGTVSVNLAGCLLFGMAYGVLERFGALQSGWALLLTVGVCGGFTTFSTFANETLALLRSGAVGALLAYALISVVGGVVMLMLGRGLATLFR